MTIIKRTNRQPVSIFDEFDNIFNNMYIGFQPIFESKSSWNPQFEVLNTNDIYIIRGDLPGILKKDVNIEVNENILTISGERKNDYNDKKNQYNYSGIDYGKFSKSFNLPDDVKYDKINASMKDGVLSLKISRVEAVKQEIKKISIK